MSESAGQVVAIHGAPRSGTSWLGQLFNSNEHVAYRYQPFFSHAFRDRVDEHTDAAGLRAFFLDLIASEDGFLRQAGAHRLATSTPVFAKSAITHLVYKEVRFHHLLPHLMDSLGGLKAVGLVRDPRAVLASWACAPREFDPAWSLSREWRNAPSKNAGLRENWYGYERWKQLAQLFLTLSAAHPERFMLMRYEELSDSPEAAVRRLFDFSGLTLTPQADRFIADSTSRDDGEPYGVFRPRGLHSPRRLPDAIGREIAQDLSGTALSLFLSESRR